MAHKPPRPKQTLSFVRKLRRFKVTVKQQVKHHGIMDVLADNEEPMTMTVTAGSRPDAFNFVAGKYREKHGLKSSDTVVTVAIEEIHAEIGAKA